MKQLTALQQQARRSNSFRGASLPLDTSVDGAIKSPATMFWLVFHGLCCLISLVLGFRFSRIVFFLFFSTSSPSATTNLYSALGTTLASSVTTSPPAMNGTAVVVGGGSRVVVGRHGILIRPWPHPDPAEVMKAHHIIERVQREQRVQYGVKSPRTIIAVTPTYVRTFQTLHLTGVMHSLMNVPYDVVWIVVEAGGTTNETAALIFKSGLKIVHIGFNVRMPTLWEDRHKMESKMRFHALRVVRERKLDGIMVFADESNMHSMELFDEIQNVEWFGAVSVGILPHSGGSEGIELSAASREDNDKNENSQMPVQGPVCNSSNQFVGWHTFNMLPLMERSARYVGDRAVVLPRKLEWAVFILNSRLVWKDIEDKPAWVKDLDVVGREREDIESPLSLLEDPSVVEPLGSCGCKIMLWWLRVEARADSKFPARWVIDPPLDVTIPAKHTPWPDAPPELPTSDVKVISIPENPEKRVTKRSTRKRNSRSKRKRVPKVSDEHVSKRQSGDN
ncbi:probable beta-1,4-xylosyltransferase IRX14H [Olea europaea var. sylvestris]|uniref:probable beta-1,4-xylosyltransferase IRX14H n=1 Tax=Olea europaea var. sylvestris TaxID=158386 RepID=UPI000C1D420F|nr:probable beta-1,4-xylosyltransferase IRX14H [Olea europaea var. sylvestris]